jgi:hypothetical protein
VHRKRVAEAQVALKIACRIPAKRQQVFVESPDFALAETLPNLRAKEIVTHLHKVERVVLNALAVCGFAAEYLRLRPSAMVLASSSAVFAQGYGAPREKPIHLAR